MDKLCVKEEINKIQESVFNLKERLGNKNTISHEDRDGRNYTPSYSKKHSFTKSKKLIEKNTILAPLAQVNNYFDNHTNSKDKEREKERKYGEYSHHRFTDTAYQRKFDYTNKNSFQNYKNKENPSKLRPSTTKNSYRSSSIPPSRSNPT